MASSKKRNRQPRRGVIGKVRKMSGQVLVIKIAAGVLIGFVAFREIVFNNRPWLGVVEFGFGMLGWWVGSTL